MPKVFKNGKLVEVAEESLADTTAAQGIPVAPLSPMGATQLGVNEHSAKMAGTAAQKTAALAEAAKPQQPQQPPSTLRDAMRHDQGDRQATDVEKQAQERGERLKQQFGGLGTQVADSINKYLNTASQEVAQGISAEGINVTGYNDQDVAALTQAVQNIAAGKGGEGDWSTIKNITGDVSRESMATFIDSDAQLEQLLNQRTPDVLPVSELGIDISPEELQELGLTTGSSVQQLQDALQTSIDQDFSTIEGAVSRMSNPNLGPNERAAAKQQLAALGAVGQLATEDEMNALQQTIDSADVVEIAGQDMTLSEILDDDHMTGFILTSLDNPVIMNKLEQSHPGLASFVKENKNALDEASINLQDQAAEVAETQEANQKAQDDLVVMFGEDMTKQLMGDEFGSFSLDEYSFDNWPALNYFMSNKDHPLIQELKQDPSVKEEIEGMNSDQLDQLAQPEQFEIWKADRQAREIVNSSNTMRDLMAGFLGDVADPDSIDNLLTSGEFRGPIMDSLYREFAADPSVPIHELIKQRMESGDFNVRGFKEELETSTSQAAAHQQEAERQHETANLLLNSSGLNYKFLMNDKFTLDLNDPQSFISAYDQLKQAKQLFKDAGLTGELAQVEARLREYEPLLLKAEEQQAGMVELGRTPIATGKAAKAAANIAPKVKVNQTDDPVDPTSPVIDFG